MIIIIIYDRMYGIRVVVHIRRHDYSMDSVRDVEPYRRIFTLSLRQKSKTYTEIARKIQETKDTHSLSLSFPLSHSLSHTTRVPFRVIITEPLFQIIILPLAQSCNTRFVGKFDVNHFKRNET